MVREPPLNDLFPRGPGNWTLDDLNLRFLGLAVKSAEEVRSLPGLVVQEVIKGDQVTEVKTGSTVRVHYIAWYSTAEVHGKLWDCTYNRGQPLELDVVPGVSYPGFIQALQHMTLGQKALAYIPPHLGYGKRGFPALVPPNAHLLVWICLESVRPPALTSYKKKQLERLEQRAFYKQLRKAPPIRAKYFLLGSGPSSRKKRDERFVDAVAEIDFQPGFDF